MKPITFFIDEKVWERWKHSTRYMRRGEKSKILRRMMEILVGEIEKGRRSRLVEIKVIEK